MNSRRLSQLILIELFALFQGMCFGIISLFSDLFLSPHFQALTLDEYNILFFIFALAGAIFAPLGGWFTSNAKGYWVFIGGMILVFLSLVLMGLTDLFIAYHTVVFFMLCTALVCLGGGVGVLMVILSQWMSAFFPKARFVVLLFLFAAFSFGVTFSVVLVELSLLLHKWWVAPFLIFVGLGASLLIFELFEAYPRVSEGVSKRGWNWKILLFVISSFLYGYIESKMGLWGGIYLMQNQGNFHEKYELYFASSWAIVTLARVCVGFLIFLIPFPFLYLFLPVVAIVAAIYFPSFSGLLILAISVLFPFNLALMSRHFSTTWLYGLNFSLYFLGIAVGPLLFNILLIASITLAIVHFFALYKTYAQKKGY